MCGGEFRRDISIVQNSIPYAAIDEETEHKKYIVRRIGILDILPCMVAVIVVSVVYPPPDSPQYF